MGGGVYLSLQGELSNRPTGLTRRNHDMKKVALLLFAGAFALASVVASAQTPMRIRGTITSLDGDVLSVKTRDGKDLKINLAP
ncbi:MAG TPA: hypothetical protein VK572_12540, partial [Burkholderiales bacterium]|nr:hypothetical protein [Burkholderiales bacterium]